jgi:hypothetical protein
MLLANIRRVFFRAKEWNFVLRIYRNGSKYFNQQQVILEGSGLTANGKHLLCFHPRK